MKTLKSPRAFTLVELLIVIGIIVILAALLMPAASKMIAKSQQTRCANNLRQLYLAATLFAQDNDGIIVNNINTNGVWPSLLAPYLEKILKTNTRHTGVLACPASKNISSAGEEADYGKNYYTGGENPQQYFDKQHHTNLKFIAVPNPSLVIFMADANNRDLDYQDESTLANGTISRSRINFRHGKGRSGQANVLFLDGHIESLRPTDAIMNVTPTPWYKLPLNPTPDA